MYLQIKVKRIAKEIFRDLNMVYDETNNSLRDLPCYEQTIEELKNGSLYQCLICTVEMNYSCQMYACQKCYRVYDYECIREWAMKQSKKTSNRMWKCPNCYNASRKVLGKNKASCWCGKQISVESNPLNPNSCGQTCNAPVCQHGCSKICHLGPHPPCMASVRLKCKCGKESFEVLCCESKSAVNKLKCNERCGLQLSCGIHKCKKVCHKEPCGSCRFIMKGDIKCYCGYSSKSRIACKDFFIKVKSKNSKNEEWMGAFACGKVREIYYECGKHRFYEKCVAPPSINLKIECPYSPETCIYCPCGKTLLTKLNKIRNKCTDAIPTCEKACSKPLSCGKHLCPMTCHEGPCMERCLVIKSARCSCGQNQFLIPCQFNGRPRCSIKCESLMSCRRHKCIERCCSGRSTVVSRSKKLFRAQDMTDESFVEAQHICVKSCNLKLSCGIHSCKFKCHSGKCPQCLESSSDDLVCPCGNTSVSAPVRCGTKLPPCNYPCINTLQGDLPCGHPAQFHKCHPLSELCSPCTFSLKKLCRCGKEKVRTFCYKYDVICSKQCGMKLDGCHHYCEKVCHIKGNCTLQCNQVCGLKRVFCEHNCTAVCHGEKPCPDTPCSSYITVSCVCGRIQKEIVCGAFSNKVSSKHLEVLTCDDDCAKLQRHLELIKAFEEGPPNPLIKSLTSFKQLNLPYEEKVLQTFINQKLWCSQIEKSLISLINNSERINLYFKPMKSEMRAFIHLLSKSFGMYSESQDMEPKRSVLVRKLTTSFVPVISLSKAEPLYKSFIEYVKELKWVELEGKSTRTLIFVPIEDAVKTDNPEIKNNAIVITDISSDIKISSIHDTFDGYLSQTLIRNPQVKLQESKLYIYPDNYLTISVNVENDMKQLVSHFNNICSDRSLGYKVGLCKLDEKLNEC